MIRAIAQAGRKANIYFHLSDSTPLDTKKVRRGERSLIIQETELALCPCFGIRRHGECLHAVRLRSSESGFVR